MKVTLSSDIGAVYVWPFCPAAPMLESLEWLTDAITSHSGLDARSRYRDKPRRAYEVRAVLTHPDYTRAANILFDGAAYPWAMPIWPERTAVDGVTAGASSLTADTDTASYGDWAIIWETPRKWEVVEIAEIDSTGDLILFGTVQADYGSARIMPLRLGRIQQIPTSVTSKPIGSVRFVWQSDDNVRSDPAAPAQYAGNDIYFDCPLLDGDGVQDGYMARIDVMDELTGLVDTKSPWAANRRTRQHKVFRKDRAESWDYRQWLHRRAGQYRAFWMPTFSRDIRIITTGALATQLLIHDDGYESREHIAVRTVAGAWVTRAVDTVARIDTDTLQITLATSLGIDAAEVDIACYLILYRLAADRVEIEHMGHDQTMSVVPTVEVPS